MTIELNRRAFLTSAGALTVSVFAPKGAFAADGQFAAQRPALTPDELASFISIRADGSAVAYFGKIDCGQGTDIGVIQIVAEELDLAPARVSLVMGDTGETVDQGGASGSTGIQAGGAALRQAAAEARRILLEMASDRLGVPVERLSVVDGLISESGAADKSAARIGYGDLVGGQFFDVKLQWNGQYGNRLAVTGKAKPKSPSQYKVVGQSTPRRDAPRRIMGDEVFVVDVKVPGMLHGRMVRPPVAGATPASIDETSIASIAGARVVHIDGFVGVVAPREWDAIRAAQTLAIKWTDAKPNFPTMDRLYDAIRNAPTLKAQTAENTGDADAAFAAAAHVIEAEYEWPFQSHASMGPACAVVDYQPGGLTRAWTASQKPHAAEAGVAAILGLKKDQVRAIWAPGPGSYGRNDAGDAVVDAALLSKAVGKPVRVQYMRNEATQWDPKAPASVHRARAAFDANGAMTAWSFDSKGFSAVDVAAEENKPHDTLAGQTMGVPLKPGLVFAAPEQTYGFPNRKITWEVAAPLLDRASPLRSSHMRDPLGPQITFASESFIDEAAYAAQTDPVAFRLKYITDPRDAAVVRAAAAAGKWVERTKPRRDTRGGVAYGQGIAYAQRHPTRVAVVANVEIDLATGKVRARRYAVAQDCGQIINPTLLHLTVEGNIVQATSRALREEVQFDRDNVTSVDWISYPILDMTEAPETIDIVLIDHPDIAPSGAGEATSRPVAAALANAIFDATGVRLRRAPFTPERLKRAGVA